jgi:hypothetical protein
MGLMRLLTTSLLLALTPLFAQTSDEKDAVEAVQKTFNGMAAHDAAMIRSTMLPDVKDQDVPGPSTLVEDFASRIASIKVDIAERFTQQPSVSIRGRIAVVWGEYEFWRDGKFDHCGIDSVNLLKTAEGWKIAAIVFTTETTGCKGR